MMPSLWISKNQLLGFFELQTEADLATHLKYTFAKHPSHLLLSLPSVFCLLKLRIIHRCICRNGFPCALIIWVVFCCYLCPGSQFRGLLVWKITNALELPVEHMHTVKVKLI